MDANQFPFLSAEDEPSRFAQLSTEELAEYDAWLAEREAAFAASPQPALMLG